ncbi:MAG: ribose 5-phosphate isomerase B [Verrucomicrobiota bacterium]
MKIAIASDHAGFRYKEKIRTYLSEKGHEIKDFGTYSDESCDYPDFIRPCAEAVAAGEYERGIVLGGSGNGEAIAANKVKGIRCGLCWNTELAKLNRKHNDGNVLSLGERVTPEESILEIVQTWIDTDFDGGRHSLRIAKLENC